MCRGESKGAREFRSRVEADPFAVLLVPCPSGFPSGSSDRMVCVMLYSEARKTRSDLYEVEFCVVGSP